MIPKDHIPSPWPEVPPLEWPASPGVLRPMARVPRVPKRRMFFNWLEDITDCQGDGFRISSVVVSF